MSPQPFHCHRTFSNVFIIIALIIFNYSNQCFIVIIIIIIIIHHNTFVLYSISVICELISLNRFQLNVFLLFIIYKTFSRKNVANVNYCNNSDCCLWIFDVKGVTLSG